MFRPIFAKSDGANGWVSLEVSPLLANDSANTNKAAARLHADAAYPNLFVKIPGTLEGIASIEQSIFDGIPINVTLLFSREHYVNAAESYLRGIERRIAGGLDPKVRSVASLFISRWMLRYARKSHLNFKIVSVSPWPWELTPRIVNCSPPRGG